MSLARQRQRLLREDTWEAQALAEELHSMFAEEIINSFEDPVVFHQPPDGAPIIQIVGGKAGDSVVQVSRNNAPVGSVTINENGDGIKTNDVDGNGNPTASSRPGDGGQRGTIASGSGNSYQVTLTNGLTVVTAAPVPVLVSGQTVPAGTVVLVNRQADGTYRFPVATWL